MTIYIHALYLGLMNKYIITVDRVTQVTLPVEVEATSEEEAEKLALKIAEETESHHWSTIHYQEINNKDLFVDSVTTFG